MTHTFDRQGILDAIRSNGIQVDMLHFDETVRRHPTTDKPESLNGWTWGWADGRGVVFGDWRHGWSKYASANGDNPLSEADRQKIEEARRIAREQRQKDREAAEDRAADLYAKAKPASPAHPYLVKKQIAPPPKLRQSGSLLLVPITDATGKLLSLQFIQDNGTKRFLKGGATAGGLFAIRGDDSGPLCICEGLATGASINGATGWTVVVAFNAGNLKAVAVGARERYPDRRIIIAGDNDAETAGNPGKRAALEAARAVGGMIALPDMGIRQSGDWNDYAVIYGLDATKEAIDAALVDPATFNDPKPNGKTPRKVVTVGIGPFLGMEFPPRMNLLNPWLGKQSIAMAHAWRGVGKTHFALNVAYAVTSGGSFLGWDAPQAAGVLYLDGEMPGPVMQERLAAIVAASDREPQAPFILVTPDLQSEGMPRLDTEEGQAAIDAILTPDIRLIVVDNISTLTACKENEADAWTPFQGWALRQRAQGRAILFIHHSNKSGTQRGTSRREDVLDTVLCLKRPVDYQPDQGAVFEIHFEKARGLWGDDVNPMEARLNTDEQGRVSWCVRSLDLCNYDKVVALLNDGLNQREVADELGLNKSTVSRHARRAKSEGLLKEVKK